MIFVDILFRKMFFDSIEFWLFLFEKKTSFVVIKDATVVVVEWVFGAIMYTDLKKKTVIFKNGQFTSQFFLKKKFFSKKNKSPPNWKFKNNFSKKKVFERNWKFFQKKLKTIRSFCQNLSFWRTHYFGAGNE